MSASDERTGTLGETGVGVETYDPADKSPDDIERDIATTRANLSETLDALERKLAPRHLLERGVDMLKGTMNGDVTGRVSETIRDNPIPLALIGLGLGWMLMSNTRTGQRYAGYAGSSARSLGRRAGDTLSGAMHSASDAASSMAGRVKGMVGGGESDEYASGGAAHAYARPKSAMRSDADYGYGGEALAGTSKTGSAQGASAGGTMERVRETGVAAWERAGDYAEYAGDQVQWARGRFAQLFEDHPLAVGAFGFLAGAVVAFSLPSTQYEDEWVGETRDQLRDQAAELGQQAVERAQQVAGRAASAAAEAAREEAHKLGESMSESGGSSANAGSSGSAAAGMSSGTPRSGGTGV